MKCELCGKEANKLHSLKLNFNWKVCEGCYEEYTIGLIPQEDLDIIERRLKHGCK